MPKRYSNLLGGQHLYKNKPMEAVWTTTYDVNNLQNLKKMNYASRYDRLQRNLSAF